MASIARVRSRSPRRNEDYFQYANDMGYEPGAWPYSPSLATSQDDYDRGFALAVDTLALPPLGTEFIPLHIYWSRGKMPYGTDFLSEKQNEQRSTGLQIRALKFQSLSSNFRELELSNFLGRVLGGGGGRPDYLQKLKVLGCIEAKFCY